jgi:hypothetical protein
MDIITVARRSLVDVVETRRARDVASSDASTPMVIESIIRRASMRKTHSRSLARADRRATAF